MTVGPSRTTRYRKHRRDAKRTDGWRRRFAVVTAFLLVSSVLAGPVLAAPSTSTPEQFESTGDSPYLEPLENWTLQEPQIEPQSAPRSKLAAAREQAAEMDPDDRRARRQQQRATDAFDEAVRGYDTAVDPTSRRALTKATVGVRALPKTLDASGRNDASTAARLDAVRNASELAVEAGRVTARWNLLVANRSIRQHSEHLSTAQEDRLKRELAAARETYERGVQQQNGSVQRIATTDRKQVKRATFDRARAISTYATAWKKAQRVRDRLEASDVEPATTDSDDDGLVDPRELLLGTDPKTNDTDGDGLEDSVETAGTGFPVDTDGDGQIDALDRDSDGDDVPDGDGLENLTDTDGDGLPNVRDTDDDGDGIPTAVEVEDSWAYAPDADFDDVTNWYDTEADGDGTSDAVEGAGDSDDDGVPNYLDNDRDNDGLPDVYEDDVTGTDPVDNDSDYRSTDREESSNDIIDGVEDVDQDTLGAHREYVLGTDPFAADTDDDGLTDGFESRRDALDPLDADSDGNGTVDGEEDADGDGLTNAREQELHTAFDRADTDQDGIDDARELELGTDPLAPDSDEDGLTDEEELALPTDPTDSDTDADGVRDGEETFETTTADESTGVSVTLRGEGNVAETVSIDPEPTFFEGASEARAGPTVRLTNESAFDSATVEIPVDASIARSDHENLSIYTWNGSTEDRWKPLETTIENGTAVAETEHFSYFTVLDTDEWVSATTVSSAAPSAGGPIGFESQANFTCEAACAVQNESTLLVGGEPNARKITIEQGDRSFQVVPLSNGQRITEFYDYANAQINSPLPIAESDTSQLFFWSGPRGLSLVVLHDKPSDGSGGEADLEFDGLPLNDGSWLVEDDPGDFDRRASSPTRPVWVWNQRRTDGGVFRGGLTNQTMEIAPYFGNRASGSYSGEITRWQALTGQATDPEAHQLDMVEPITVHVPEAPAENESAATAGDSGSANFEYQLPRGRDELSVRYQTEQTNVDPAATVTIEDSAGRTVQTRLNVGTVGTVEEGLNVSSLSSGAVDVTIDVEGMNVRAQLLAGEEQLDADDDGIPDRLEDREWTPMNGPVSSFETRSGDNDTDGDGLLDGEEVEFVPETVDGEQQLRPRLVSDPSDPDTDGDGLSDAEEREGWQAELATTRRAAEAYQDARASGAGDARDELTMRSVESNPLVADTDGDDVADLTEFAWRSDPSASDSDGDTILDGNEEPGKSTIHDLSAPTVTVRSIEATGFQRDSYDVQFYVTDDSGVDAVQIFKNGREQYAAVLDASDGFGGEVGFEIDLEGIDQITSPLAGLVVRSSVDIAAMDAHGNRDRKSYLGKDTYGDAAEIISDLPLLESDQNSAIALMAFASGVTTTFSSLVQDVVDLLRNYREYAQQIREFAAYVTDNWGVLTELPGMMAQQFQTLQENHNPFEEGTLDHTNWAATWYFGFLVGEGLLAVATMGIGAVLTRVARSSTLVRNGLSAISRAKTAIKQGAKLRVLAAAGKIAKRLPDVDVDTGRIVNELADLPASARDRVLRNTQQLGKQTKDALADSSIPTPGASTVTTVKYSGAAGGAVLDAMTGASRAALKGLLRLADDVRTQRAMLRAWSRRDVSHGELKDSLIEYNRLDATDRRAYGDLIQRANDDAVRLPRQQDSDSFGEVVAKYDRLSNGERDRFAALVRDDDLQDSWLRVVSDTEISPDEVSKAIDRAEDVGEAGRVTDFNKGEELNKELPYEDPEPVHRPDSIVVDYDVYEQSTYNRLYNKGDGGSDKSGEYVFKDGNLVERNSVDDLSDKLSLPNDPDAVAVVHVQPDSSPVSMRVSTAADNRWGDGGATQHIFVDGEEAYDDDWFEYSEPLTQKLIED